MNVKFENIEVLLTQIKMHIHMSVYYFTGGIGFEEVVPQYRGGRPPPKHRLLMD